MRILGYLSSALLGLALIPAAHAQIRPGSVELGVFGGVWEGDQLLDDAGVLGLRAAYNLTRVFGLELHYSGVSTTAHPQDARDFTKRTDEDKFISQLGLNAILNMNYAVINPYISGGLGMVNVDEADLGADLGLGVRYHITDLLVTQLDVRGWFSPDAPANDSYAHVQMTLGLGVQLGGDDDIDKDGIANREDACPTQAEDKDDFEDSDGCPDEDNDKDEIKDVDDKCPNKAEDKDGDRDDDGCPDLDDDEDGVQNEADKCPKEKEDTDGFQDDDGCPDPDNDQDKILDTVDKCPNDAEDMDGFEDADGCPEADNDKDGIEDAKDKCPNDAEDKDGFEDEDGCPDLDHDRDGILDSVDKCPTEPETFNGVDDEDGCPDTGGKVKLTCEKIEIADKVYFASGKAIIKKKSYSLLDQVSSVLGHASFVTKIRIEGHTDDRGRDALNKTLSQARADAVRGYLMGKGITAERLEAVGFGEEKPVDTNKTRKGRANNRRVAFEIAERSGECKP